MKVSVKKRVYFIVLLMAGLTAGGVIYEWIQDVPDYSVALGRGYFLSVGVLSSYWAFKFLGWIRD